MTLLRPPEGSVLIVLRAGALAFGGAAVIAALFALLFGAGGGSQRLGDLEAQLVLGGATITSAVGIALVGRSWEPPPREQALAAAVFTLVLRRLVVASMVLPVGLVLSWSTGDETWIIFGAGATLLLMAVAGPSSDRIDRLQEQVEEAGVDLSVRRVLSRPYR
jgi:hypothetical protein